MSQDFDHLLATVRANPADNAPRLVLAGWLEDHGQDETWAQFIDVQVQLADYAACQHPESAVQLTSCDGCRQRSRLRQRELEYWPDVRNRFTGVIEPVIESRLLDRLRSQDNPGWPFVIVRRGFPAEVMAERLSQLLPDEVARQYVCDRCQHVTTLMWASLARRCSNCGSDYVRKSRRDSQGILVPLVARWPITRAVAANKYPTTRRTPYDDGWEYVWHNYSAYFHNEDIPYRLPYEVWNQLYDTVYTSHAAAIDAASNAVLAAARKRVMAEFTPTLVELRIKAPSGREE